MTQRHCIRFFGKVGCVSTRSQEKNDRLIERKFNVLSFYTFSRPKHPFVFKKFELEYPQEWYSRLMKMRIRKA